MIIDQQKAESHSGEGMQMSDPYLVTNRADALMVGSVFIREL